MTKDDPSPLGGVLGGIGLLLLAITLISMGIHGLVRPGLSDGQTKYGIFGMGKTALIVMIALGIGSAIGGIALLVVTLK